jgi:hypothetical protein
VDMKVNEGRLGHRGAVYDPVPTGPLPRARDACGKTGTPSVQCLAPAVGR